MIVERQTAIALKLRSKSHKAIAIDKKDANFIGKKLDLEPKTNSEFVNTCWNKELQLNKNKPLMSLIKQWQENKMGKTITKEEAQEYRNIQQALKRNI